MSVINISGGLGDIFCKLVMEEFKYHALQNPVPIGSSLHVYSDNPGSAELFAHSKIFSEVVKHCHGYYEDTYVELEGTGGLGLIVLSEEEKNIYNDLQYLENICVFHPFSATPYKRLPSSIDKKLFIDIMIDKYNYTVVILNQETPIIYSGQSILMEESFDYRRNNLINIIDYTNNISRLGAWITAYLASKIIALDSAYIMLRNSYKSIEKQNTLALFWGENGEQERGFNPHNPKHYYIRGLNQFPNMYTYYKDIKDIEQLIDKFMEIKC